MALGYTASFSTSHIRPYTGPTGPNNSVVTGTGGVAGASSSTGATGPIGPIGVTGSELIGTYFQNDPSKPAFGYYVLRFSDGAGNEVTAAPRGLTGQAGPVVGAFPNILNTSVGTTGIFNGITTGTIIGHANAPYFGVCGSTLTFRRLGVSGDLVFYSDLVKIGTGPTYSVIGISGPQASKLYGTVLGQSVGELAYLIDQKSVKDAYGLTFTDQGSIVPPDAGDGGLTWGTISPKLYNSSNFYHVHGNEIDGVQKDPFNINTEQGSVHLVYAPFTLNDIVFTKHAKDPISIAPHWETQRTKRFGSTADYGEANLATLIIKNGPAGISFSNKFYFDPNNNTFSTGVNIVNCLSYDEGASWLCSIAGKNYNTDKSNLISYGACCDYSVSFTCDDFISEIECADRGGSFEFYPDTPCSETPCNLSDVEGSCCLNKNHDNEQTLCIDSTNSSGIPVTREFCDRFGGNFRALVPCDSEKYPCDPDVCDDDFGLVGACCQFELISGNYYTCTNNLSANECFELGEQSDLFYTIFQGVNTYCSSINCCDSLTKYGACCLSDGLCTDEVSPEECTSIGGIYMGHNTECISTPCVCDPPNHGGGPVIGPAAIGACCTTTGALSCCTEGQIFEDCNYPNQTWHMGMNCDQACPSLPTQCGSGPSIDGSSNNSSGGPNSGGVVGKCCKNCSSCSSYDFECNDLYVNGGCGRWVDGAHENGSISDWCDGPNLQEGYSDFAGRIFGGFPLCSCTDNITQEACKSLSGEDANWTPGETCHITDAGQSICFDPKFAIGTCCLPRFNDNPEGGYDFDAVDCSYPPFDGVVGTCSDWECSSCTNANQCAIQINNFYPVGSKIYGFTKTAENFTEMTAVIEAALLNLDYGPLTENGGDGTTQPYWRSYGNCVGADCPRLECGGCPNVATSSTDGGQPTGNPNTRCGYCSEYMTFPNFIDDNAYSPTVICPP